VYQLKESPYGSHMLLLKLLPTDGAGYKVLDLGCASGYLSSLLASRGFAVTGVERHAPEFLEGVRLIEHDLEQGLPAFHEKFDFVVLADVLEHLRDPVALLRQVQNVLTSNGMIVASLPNSGNLYFRLNVIAGRFPKHDRGLFDRTHLHFFVWKGWVELFHEAGFEICRVQSSSLPFSLLLGNSAAPRVLEMLWYTLARAWKKLFAYQFVCLAKVAEP
jgi:SAM-dependent methyltransferase